MKQELREIGISTCGRRKKLKSPYSLMDFSFISFAFCFLLFSLLFIYFLFTTFKNQMKGNPYVKFRRQNGHVREEENIAVYGPDWTDFGWVSG